MKLWWPHSEAMIAFLMGYSETGDPALLRIFYQVAEYTFHRVSAASWSQQRCGDCRLGGEGESSYTSPTCPSADMEVPAPIPSVESTEQPLPHWSSHFAGSGTDHKQVNKQTKMGMRALGNTARSGGWGAADGKEKSWKGCSAKRGQPDSGVHGCWGFGRGGHRAPGQGREMAWWLSSWPVSGGLTWGGRCNRSRAQSLVEWEESELATSVWVS